MNADSGFSLSDLRIYGTKPKRKTISFVKNNDILLL